MMTPSITVTLGLNRTISMSLVKCANLHIIQLCVEQAGYSEDWVSVILSTSRNNI